MPTWNARISSIHLSSYTLHHPTMDAETARKNWELENNITTVDPTQDQIYYYDAQKNKEALEQRPWKTKYTPRYAWLETIDSLVLCFLAVPTTISTSRSQRLHLSKWYLIVVEGKATC